MDASEFLQASAPQSSALTATSFLDSPTPDEQAAMKKKGDDIVAQQQRNYEMNGQTFDDYLASHPTPSTITAQHLMSIADTPEKKEKVANYIRDTKAAELPVNNIAEDAWKAVNQGPIPEGEHLLQANPTSTTGKVALGAERTGENIGNFLLSPLGIATLGIGTLPRAAQRGIALAFAAQMASTVPDQAAQLLQEVNKDPKDRDWTKISELLTGTAANGILATLGAAHGFAPKTDFLAKSLAGELDKQAPARPNLPEPTPQVRQAGERPAAPGITAEQFLQQSNEQTSSKPEPVAAANEPKPAASAGPDAKNESGRPAAVSAGNVENGSEQPETLRPALLAAGKPVIGGETHKDIFQRVMSDTSATRDDKIATANAMLDDSKHVFVDQNGKVYDRAQAAKAFDQIQGNPAGTTTVLHSEMLAPKPVAPRLEPMPTIQSVRDMNPDQFVDFTKKLKGGLTGGAYQLGLSVRTPEELNALKAQQSFFSEQGQKARLAKDFNNGISYALKSQFFREAYEAATGTASAGDSLRKTDPNYKPPFPIEPVKPNEAKTEVPQNGQQVAPKPVSPEPASGPKTAAETPAAAGSAEPVKPSLADKIVATLDTQAEAARARIRARSGQLKAGLDPSELADYAIIGASHIAKGVVRFADWSKAMVGEFGDRVKPHLKEIFAASHKHADRTSTVTALEGGKSVYGIAERVRDARAKSGQVAPVPSGEGVSAESSVIRGRKLLEEGVSPEETVEKFEQTKTISADSMAVVRARGEQLANMAKQAEEKFGTDSDEYRIAWHLLSEWDTRIKPMQTEWHKIGQAQQGETDIDTGTFTGLQRYYKDVTGKEFTPEQSKKAKDFAEQDKKANRETEEAKQKLFKALDDETKEPEKPAPKPEVIEPHVRLIADKLKEYFKTRANGALERIKARRSEGRLFTGIDPSDLVDYADYGASKIIELGIEAEKRTEDWTKAMVADLGDYIKPHLDTIWTASKKAFLDGFKKNVAIGETSRKVKRAIKQDVDTAAQRALDAANSVVRRAASDLAKAETAARVKAAGLKKEVYNVQVQAAKKALDAANKRVREAATMAAEAENRRRIKEAELRTYGEPGSLDALRKMLVLHKPGEEFSPREVKAIWDYARSVYIDKGVTNFDDVRNKLATDLGIHVNEITKALAAPKNAKRLTDEVWKKQQDARRVSEAAKRWVNSANMPNFERYLRSVPNSLFALKVGFHGTVALGTHAPMVAFQPHFWSTYFKDFLTMYRMVGSKALYEKESQDLIRRPNYIMAKRSGLVNDPFKVEDFNNPMLSQYTGKMTEMGNRGYFVLKILRQDMFDQMWSQLPESAQVPDVAKAISDGINHTTGVVKSSSPQGSSLALFAPRLEFSRVSWLVVDPVRALRSFAAWDTATPAEKIFAINQIKEKATVAATLFGLLVVNQGILSAVGSNQNINFTNPMKNDFLKFKGAGMTFSYGNAMLSMARLPVRLYAIRESDGGKLKNLIFPDEDTYSVLGEYARSQLSPFASLALDLWFKSDWQNRPLPNSNRPVPKRLAVQGVKPYTWPEFWSEQLLPIPLEEAMREVWGKQYGMNEETMQTMLKTMATIAVMAGTGGRLVDDPDASVNTPKKSVLSE
jgi:hypothetical protein